MIGGKLLIGNNLIIENRNDTGVMQFRVDASGAWLYNSTFVLVSDYGGKISLNSANPIMPIADTFSGGKIIIDPRYGIVAGNGNLFTTSGTTVTPSFIQDDGSLELDEDYLPKNANFFLDIRDGNAYFRGRIKATKGKIGGWIIEDDYLYAGSGSTRVGMNAGAKYDPYAFWAGGDSPVNANFWVKKNGDIYANNGTFRGTVNTRTFLDPNKNNQAMMQDGKFIAEYLDLYGITIRRKSNNTISFQVDAQGNVTIDGAVKMGAGSSISWNNIDETGSDAYQAAGRAESAAGTAQSTANAAQTAAGEAAKAASDAADAVLKLATGQYNSNSHTFIDKNNIYSPNIYTNNLKITPNQYTGGNQTAGLTLYGFFQSNTPEIFMQISPTSELSPKILMKSDYGADLLMNFAGINLTTQNLSITKRTNQYNGTITIRYQDIKFSDSSIDFDGATIYNLHATFA